MNEEPFGRQPKLVEVIITGDPIDVAYWIAQLMQRAEFKGDMTQRTYVDRFTIHPRAVND